MTDSHLLLFDIDGVLINPIGYRKATADTIAYFFEIAGIPDVEVKETEIAAFEAQGITSEWEIIPLYILTWLEANISQEMEMAYLDNWVEFKKFCQRFTTPYKSNYDLILKIHNLLKVGYTPSESIVLAFEQRMKISSLFHFLSDQRWLARQLLENHSSSYKSDLLTRFQNKVQGKQDENTDIENESYLKKYDQILISPHNVDRINSLRQNKKIFVSAITARPTYVPGLDHKNYDFPQNYPEGEVALEKVGLSDIPVAGYGQIQYLHAFTGIPIGQLIKPSYIHALAGLCLAANLSLDQIASFFDSQKEMHGSYPMFKNFKIGNLSSVIDANQVHLHVFEDAVIGIQSVRRLQAMLYANGIHALVHAYGIGNDVNKVEALKKENACIYSSINQAFEKFLVIHF